MSEFTQGVCGEISISVDYFLHLIKADSRFVEAFEIVSADVHETASMRQFDAKGGSKCD